MICTQGTEKRTGKNSIQDGEAIQTFWRKLGGTTETLDPFDKVYQRPMKNKCTGDSGSPLTTTQGNKVYVHGIASFGADNCDYPNVYARVSVAKTWIAKEVCKGLLGRKRELCLEA